MEECTNKRNDRQPESYKAPLFLEVWLYSKRDYNELKPACISVLSECKGSINQTALGLLPVKYCTMIC